MIDLGPLGVLQGQGLIYLPFLMVALVVCALNRPFKELGLLILINWLGTRLLDVGGYFGDQMVAAAMSEQMAVTSIAMSLTALDVFVVALLLYFQRDLKLTVLIAALYGCMLPFYSFAAIGWMTGGAALFWVNILGLIQLAFIIAAGGIALVHRRRSLYDRHPFLTHILDFVAPRVVAAPNMERDSGASRLS